MKALLDSLRSSLPKYIITQPSTKKKITYRPFTVREEKILLMSNQTGEYEDFLTTLADIIDNCFELETKSKKLPIFDIEYFFIKLRSKSIGEQVEPIIVCKETKEKIQLNLNLDDIIPIYPENHSKTVAIGSDIIVNMKYPSLEYLISNKDFDYYDMLIDCIDTIETKSELIDSKVVSRESIKEFIDLLTKKQFESLIEFFKTMPKIEKEIEYKTSDGVTRKILLRGLRDFFQ